MKIIDINGNNRECVTVRPDVNWPGYMKAVIVSGRGTHTEWYPVDEFFKMNPKLKDLIKETPKKKEEDLGIVTESKHNSLTDKKKNWKNNVFTGTPVWISRGKGEGQTRTVTSNTKSTIIVDKDWEILPDTSSQYVVSENVHNPHIFGNTLPQSDMTRINKARKEK